MKIPDDRIPGGCSIAGVLDTKEGMVSGNVIIEMISVMHERSNGLGGGFAGYGIYPEYKDKYCFHVMYLSESAKSATESFLQSKFKIIQQEIIPTRPIKTIKNRPLLWRYFLEIKPEIRREHYELVEDDIVMKFVMNINEEIENAFVVSSGRNMGIFKGVGYPEEMADFYRIDEYNAFMWISHGRFPTNTPGWWGGAHPFGLLDFSLVHNGEISSYGINKRYLESFGYKLMLQTDSEAILYLFDLLLRRHKLSIENTCAALAPPFWSEIERMPEEKKNFIKNLRLVYGSALINGPSSLIVGFKDNGSYCMMGLNDRIKLRPMCAATAGDLFYLSSEECAIRNICTKPQKVWAPAGGEPVIGKRQVGS
ncbi:MAG: glutamine amidotransferase family protein [Elusimicrobiota bacterium]